MNEQTIGATGNGPRYPYIALDEWKAQAKTGAASKDVTLIKGRSLDQINTVKNERDALRIVISTDDEDRSRDVIDQGGWELANFLANPVVLWAHDYWSPSIAKAPRTYPEAGKLVSYPEFCPEDLQPFAHMIGRMVREGYLSAASVGFRPLEWTYDEQRGGVNFVGQELMEYSIVPVPDNPFALNDAKAAWQEALSKSVAKGLDITPVLAMVEASAGFLVKSGIVSGDAEREQALRVLTRGAVSVEVPPVEIPNTDLPGEAKAQDAPQQAAAEVPGSSDVQVPAVPAEVKDAPDAGIVAKAGREISAKNEKAIRAAVDAISAAAAAATSATAELMAILERIAPAEDEGDDDGEKASRMERLLERIDPEGILRAAVDREDRPVPVLVLAAEPAAGPVPVPLQTRAGAPHEGVGEVLVLSIPNKREEAGEVMTIGPAELQTLKSDLTVELRKALKAFGDEMDRERAGVLP